MKPRRPQRRLQPETLLLIRQVLVGLMVFTFFGLLFSTIWYGTRVDALTIDTITVEGGETIDHAQVEEKLRTALVGTYFGLVPKTFAFTYPEQSLYDSARSIDRIKDITITRVGGTELQVTFSEFTPHALWCRSEDESQCVFLDETGYAFGAAPRLEGGSLLRVVGIGRTPEPRTQAFPSETYLAVHDLVAALAEVNWFIDRVDIDTAGDAFMRVVGGGEFKVSLKTPAPETIANLQTVLASADFSDLTPGLFQYIDLRFGSKVFVNETTAPAATTTDLYVPGEGVLAENEVPEPAPDDVTIMSAVVEEPTIEEAEVATTTAE